MADHLTLILTPSGREAYALALPEDTPVFRHPLSDDDTISIKEALKHHRLVWLEYPNGGRIQIAGVVSANQLSAGTVKASEIAINQIRVESVNRG